MDSCLLVIMVLVPAVMKLVLRCQRTHAVQVGVERCF